MSGFDLGNLGALMGGFQQRMAEMKQRAAAARHVGEAGGGVVKVTMSGDYQPIEISIDPKVMDDREMLEDLLKVATAEAVRKVKSEMEASLQQLTGGLPIPPGLLPF
jgi:nucleoid-associated protein EbfC